MGLDIKKTRDGSPEIEIQLPEKEASITEAGLIQFATLDEVDTYELPTKAISPLVFGKGKANGIAPLDKTSRIPLPFVRITKSNNFPTEADSPSIWLKYPDIIAESAEFIINYEEPYSHYVSGVGIYTGVKFQIANIGNKSAVVNVYVGDTLIKNNVSVGISGKVDFESDTKIGASGTITVKDSLTHQVYVQGYTNWSLSLQNINIAISNDDYSNTFIDNVGTYQTLNYTITNNGPGVLHVNIYLGNVLIQGNVEMLSKKIYSYTTGQLYNAYGKIIVRDYETSNIYYQSEKSYELKFEPVPVTILSQMQHSIYDDSTTYIGVQYTVSNSSDTYNKPIDIYLDGVKLHSALIVPTNNSITYNTGKLIDVTGILTISETESQNRLYTGTKVWSLTKTQSPIAILSITELKATSVVDYDHGILYNGVECTLNNVGTDVGEYSVYIGNRLMSTYTINMGEAEHFTSGSVYGITGKLYVYDDKSNLLFVSDDEYSCTRDINEPWTGLVSTQPGIPKENSDTEWLIYTPNQLAKLAKNVNEGNTYKGYTFTIMNVLDLNNKQWTPIGDASHLFEGTFDGNNKQISNLNINVSNFGGLFGNISNAVIKNVTINNANIQGTNFIGTIVGNSTGNSNILSCNVSTGNIVGNSYIGGILGYTTNANITLSNCIVTEVNISGASHIGGIVGSIISNNTQSQIISSQYKKGAENTAIIGATNVGGIVGLITNCVLTNCASSININGSTTNIGGIVGSATDSAINYPITNGNISGGGSMIGGIIGTASNTSISKSNLVNISITECGSYIGGIVGYLLNNSNIYGINNISVSIQNSGASVNVGGVAGYSNNTKITSCSYISDITAYYRVGGIIGTAYDTDITNCINSGNIKSTATGNLAGTGGLIGYAENINIYNSANTKNITGNNEYIGGLIGQFISGVVLNSVSTGTINSTAKYQGSIVGGTEDTDRESSKISFNNVYAPIGIAVVVGDTYTAWSGITKLNSWNAIIAASASGGNSITYWPTDASLNQITVTTTGDEKLINGLLGNSNYKIYY